MADPTAKLCVKCCESIPRGAVRCPKCQSWQSLKAMVLGNPQAWGAILTLPLAFLPIYFLSPMLRRGEDFSSYRDQVSIIESRLEVSDGSQYNSVVTVGRLRNDSPVKWNHVVIEVQYFDKQGTLIGAKTDEDFDMVLVPGVEHAFQLECNRVRPAKDYDSQKVYVRNARDASKWP